MKKNIAKYLLALATVALVGGGCSVNDFNEKLDGFQGGSTPTNIQTVSRTLSAADYSAIASNKTNIAIAKELGPAAEAALKAIGDHKCISADDAQLYLPAFLSPLYSFLDNKSAIEVSYLHKDKGSDILEKGLQKQYTLVNADYDAAWGPGNTTPFFTPEKPAATYLPAILKAKIATPQAGDYAVATYSYLNGEPEPVEPAAIRRYAANTRAEATITAIKDLNYDKATVYTIEATVAATYAKGLLVEDATGSILLYTGTAPTYALGDKIQVAGASEKYFNVPQMVSKGMTTELVAPVSTAFNYPTTPTVITSANIPTKIPAADGNPNAYDPFEYLQVTGTVVADGNYFNVKIKGAADGAFAARITNHTDVMQLAGLLGKEVTMNGYLISYNEKYLNFGMMVTSIAEVGQTAPMAIGVVNTTKGTAVNCKGYVTALHAQGFLISDGTGTTLIYQKAIPTVEIGDIVTLSGTSDIYFSMPQIKNPTAITKVGKVADVTKVRPTIAEMTGEEMDAYYAATPYYRYVKYTGILKITADAKNYEIHEIEGGTKPVRITSPTEDQKLEFAKYLNKEVIITSFLSGTNTSSAYISNVLVTFEPAVKYPTETRYAVYGYNGSAWVAVEAASATAINEADYLQMSLSGLCFDKVNTPSNYLPAFLNKTYPYAQQKQQVTIFYNYNEGSKPYMSGTVYQYTGTAWEQSMASEQYVKSEGQWKFNPSPTFILNPDKGDLSVKFYQACVDYVLEAKDPAYTTKDGTRLTRSEFYSGCASDFTNLNWRINTLPWYYWKVAEGEEAVKVYEAWSDKDKNLQKAAYKAFYAEVEKRFGEVMSAALAKLYPSAKMIPGVDIIYTVQMMVYTQHIASSTGRVTHAFEFKLVDTGKFEYKGMYALDSKFELMNEENFK